nr:MAG TPA: hypothetical protein [Caudoviricetes sp.]
MKSEFFSAQNIRPRHNGGCRAAVARQPSLFLFLIRNIFH